MLDRCATHVAMLDYGNMVEFSAVDQLRARHATIRDLIVGYMGLG